MNKTLLLIICDFLLLNLLALTRWEKAEPPKVSRSPVTQTSSQAVTKEQDLVDTMRQSLADEQALRDQIARDLAAKEQSLTRTEAENQSLSKDLDATKNRAADLGGKLSQAAQDAATLQARMAALQRDLDRKEAEADQQRKQLLSLEKAQGEARQRIENLSVAVKVAEQEKVLLKQTTEALKQQVDAERQERQKVQETTSQLAQGVGQLAEKSGELTKEIRENRPINANTLFNDFLSSRVSVHITAARSGNFLGASNKESDTQTLFVTDGTSVYALFHIDESPFGFMSEFATDWNRITVKLSKGGRSLSPSTLGFLSVDPRILALKVDAADAANLGVKIYNLAMDPFKFPEAMLINRSGNGYGETPFKLDPGQPAYVRMDNRLIKRLMGDFPASRGDIVFSKSGELLGIMVSSDYCGVVNNLLIARSIQLGDTSNQSTGKILQEMEGRVRSLPFKMQ